MSEESFEDIVSRTGHIIGAQETAARQALGDARYDEMMAHNDAVAEASLDNTRAVTTALQGLTILRITAAGGIIVSALSFAAVALRLVGRGW